MVTKKVTFLLQMGIFQPFDLERRDITGSGSKLVRPSFRQSVSLTQSTYKDDEWIGEDCTLHFCTIDKKGQLFKGKHKIVPKSIMFVSCFHRIIRHVTGM